MINFRDVVVLLPGILGSVLARAGKRSGVHQSTRSGAQSLPSEVRSKWKPNRQTYFFGAPDPALNKADVVMRARRIQGGDADTVGKLRVMEVSTKCFPKETFRVAADFKAYLAGHGIVLGADQSAKSKNSLEFFRTTLQEEGQAG